MMDGIRQWLLGILAAAMGLSLLYALLPKGAVRAAAKAAGGLILLLAVLGPAAGLDLSDLAVRYEDLSRDRPKPTAGRARPSWSLAYGSGRLHIYRKKRRSWGWAAIPGWRSPGAAASRIPAA